MLWVGASRWTSQRPREPNQPHLNNLRETKPWVLSAANLYHTCKTNKNQDERDKATETGWATGHHAIMKGMLFYHNSRWRFGEGEEVWNNEFTQRDQVNQNYPNKVFEFEQTKSLSCLNYSTWVSLPNETKGRGSSGLGLWMHIILKKYYIRERKKNETWRQGKMPPYSFFPCPLLTQTQ